MNQNLPFHPKGGFGGLTRRSLSGRSSSRWSRVLLSGAVFLGIAACRDATGPKRDIAARHDSFPINVEVTITDYDDGTQYTLNTLAQEIRMSDGRVLALDSAQTADALAAFYGTIATDPVATSLATVGTYTCPEPYTPTGCYELMQDKISKTGPRTSIQLSGQLSSVSPQGNRPSILIKRLGKVKRGLLNHPVFPGGVGDDPLHLDLTNSLGLSPTTSPDLFSGLAPRFDYGPGSNPCEQIATEAVNAAFDYFSGRTSFIKNVWGIALPVAADEFKRHMPPGTQAAVSFTDLLTGTAYSKVKVGAEALYWNQYDCSNKKVEVGPFYFSGSGGNWVCEPEHWEISFDGGETWHPIVVTVCWAEA